MSLKKIMPNDQIAYIATGNIGGKVSAILAYGKATSSQATFVGCLFFMLLSFPTIISLERHPKHVSQLERVLRSGEIKVATRYSPSTYYEGPKGYAGLGYDLVQLFAKRLGVQARFVVPDSSRQITRTVESRKADFAAAGLMVTEARKRSLRFSPAYRKITEQVINIPIMPNPVM